jgi:hypothetical protein
MKPISKQVVLLFFIAIFLNPFNCLYSQANRYPVVIVGGTAGGTAAALQIARQGIPVLLIEQTNWLGGSLTTAGASAINENINLNGGIWYEFREALQKHYGNKSLASGWAGNVMFEPKVGDSIFKKMVAQESKITVWYNYTLHKVQKTKNTITSIDVKNSKGKATQIQAFIFIDATETGDLMEQANDDYLVGEDDPKKTKENIELWRNKDMQNIYWIAVLKDYGKRTPLAKPKDYDASLYYCCCKDATCVSAGHTADKIKMLNYGKLPNGSYLLNWPVSGNDFYVDDFDVSNSKLEKAKLKTLGFIYFLQTELQLTTLNIDSTAFDTKDKLALRAYSKQSRRMVGQQTLTINHLQEPYNFTLYKHGVAVGDYQVNTAYKQMPGSSAKPTPLIPAFNIGLGSLQSKKITNLLACDKNISVSNIVSGATYAQPICIGTGQAAGALAAAMITSTNQSVKGGLLRNVQNQLLKSNAYLFPTHDIDINHQHFALIQKTLVNGIMEGIPAFDQWSTKMYFKPDSAISYAALERGLNRIIPSLGTRNSNDKSPITLQNFTLILNEAGKSMFKELWKYKREEQVIIETNKILETQYNYDQVLTRLQIAILIDSYFRPFDFTVID